VLVVRGTKKFLDRVGPPAASVAAPADGLGDWYANVWFWRPQVAIFVEERSLLPVIVPFAPASSVIDRFPSAFEATAGALGIPSSAVRRELATMDDRVLARTASRSVLGVMNEFGHLADNYRWRHEEIDLLAVSLWLAQVPCTPLLDRHGTPGDTLRALLT